MRKPKREMEERRVMTVMPVYILVVLTVMAEVCGPNKERRRRWLAWPGEQRLQLNAEDA